MAAVRFRCRVQLAMLPVTQNTNMKIYIASSWKNQHGVEMLTKLLREKGHEVISWVENNYGETHNHVTKKFAFEDWVNSIDADQSFWFDIQGAMTSEIVIYYGPAGKDACVELGAAYAAGAAILGLYAKGEDLGLMRKVVSNWHERFTDLLDNIQAIQHQKDLIEAKMPGYGAKLSPIDQN
jgi:hypothetical protein